LPQVPGQRRAAAGGAQDDEREAHAQAAAVAHEIDIAIQAALLSAGSMSASRI
jgi:hypothetical protein